MMPARDVRAGTRAAGAFTARVRAIDFGFERFGLGERNARVVVTRARDADAARASAAGAAARRGRLRGTRESFISLALRLLDQRIHGR
jgi:hypothetical protein